MNRSYCHNRSSWARSELAFERRRVALELEVVHGRGFVISQVDMIVGDGGAEVPGFMARKDESYSW